LSHSKSFLLDGFLTGTVKPKKTKKGLLLMNFLLLPTVANSPVSFQRSSFGSLLDCHCEGENDIRKGLLLDDFLPVPNAYKLKSQSPVRNGMNEMEIIPFTPADQGRERGRGDGGGEEIDGSPHHTRLDPGHQNKI
jgi:hypothetical protein